MKNFTRRMLPVLGAVIVSVAVSGCSLSRSKSNNRANANANRTDNRAAETPEPSGQSSNDRTSDTTNSANEISDELHTPERGSLEREGMMNALRAAFDDRSGGYYTPHRGNIVFVVNYLKAHNGWAWTYADPTSSDKSDSFGEFSGFLLHSEGGQWKVMKLPPMVDDPNDPENLDYPSRRDVEKIRQKYPTAPADIFPRP